MKGLICSILEDKRLGNCSNNGISNRYKEVLLVGAAINGIFEESNERPTVKLIYSESSDYVHAESIIPVSMDKIRTAGGCFIYSCDGRFPATYPIPLHDREDTWKAYYHLSE
jgi:hypothetical protein